METPPVTPADGSARVQKVEVVSRPSFQEELRSATGPYLEFLGVGSFVLILVLFMLMGREELSDRIVGLFDERHVSLTTRTMQEIAQRISRYLATFALVNSAYGLVVGLGLGLIGVPYAVLWGCLAAMLRFIPYIGPAVAFVLPLVFSFAHFPGWLQPLGVLALFGVVEAALNSYLEPVIYGKTTGVSALGLLVAAMFWTWLWGSLGLLLSTPLTVCLAVLGKYVPGLRFFGTLLGEEAALEPDVRLYQRLVALDREGATELIEAELRQRPRVEVLDRVLVPALSRAERDVTRGELDGTKQAFVWGFVGQVLDGLEGTPDFSLAAPPSAAGGRPESDDADPPAEPVLIAGLAIQDTSDVLVLRMLGQLLASSGCRMEIITGGEPSMQVAEWVAEQAPRLVVVSHLPPEGFTLARYLVRQLRARFKELPILVGHWGEGGGAATVAEKLTDLGATCVVSTLAEARERILVLAFAERGAQDTASVLPA